MISYIYIEIPNIDDYLDIPWYTIDYVGNPNNEPIVYKMDPDFHKFNEYIILGSPLSENECRQVRKGLDLSSDPRYYEILDEVFFQNKK